MVFWVSFDCEWVCFGGSGGGWEINGGCLGGVLDGVLGAIWVVAGCHIVVDKNKSSS